MTTQSLWPWILFRKKLVGLTFRSLQGIYLPVFVLGGHFRMGGHVAGSGTPFDGRLRKAHAVVARSVLKDLLATLALLYNGVAATAIELAAVFAHKCAVNTLFNSCTNHGYHILSSKIISDLKPKKRSKLYAYRLLQCQEK